MKTSDLLDHTLDWAVAKADGRDPYFASGYIQLKRWIPGKPFSPSTDGSQGVPIIDREGIYLRAVRRDGHSLDGKWLAQGSDSNTGGMVQWVKREDWRRHYYVGPTLLIAAMRCYVASKLGDEVEIPEELL